jgi:hypothetical protein
MTGTAARAQTVDEILERNLEALGGRIALDRVQSMRTTSRLVLPGSEARIIVYSKRPNLVRQELRIAGQTVVQAFDGSTGWTVNRLLGMSTPTLLNGADLDALRQQAVWEGLLTSARSRGDRIELVGRSVVNGRQAFHLRVTSVDHQRHQQVYVDVDTGLEIRTVHDTSAGRFEQDLSSYQAVEGILVPFSIKTSVGGRPVAEIVVAKVEINVDVESALFARP